MLINSTARWQEVQWASVSNVPCRGADGAAGCCTHPFSFRYGSTDYYVFQQVSEWEGGAGLFGVLFVVGGEAPTTMSFKRWMGGWGWRAGWSVAHKVNCC